MAEPGRSRSGMGLLAAAAVFVVAFFVREANNEPAGAVAALAAVFGVLGLKQLLASKKPTTD